MPILFARLYDSFSRTAMYCFSPAIVHAHFRYPMNPEPNWGPKSKAVGKRAAPTEPETEGVAEPPSKK